MTDAEYAEQKARIQKLIDKWLEPLGLCWWRITFEWDRTTHVEPEGNAAGSWCTVAKCAVRWKYFQACMTWRLLNILHVSDEDLEHFFVHECMHIFLNEMREEDEDLGHEERVASMLTNAFLWVGEMMADKRVIAEDVGAQS